MILITKNAKKFLILTLSRNRENGMHECFFINKDEGVWSIISCGGKINFSGMSEIVSHGFKFWIEDSHLNEFEGATLDWKNGFIFKFPEEF